MRKRRFNYLLAGTVLALAAAAPCTGALAAPDAVESRVPLPPTANMPPPSRRDIEPAAPRPATVRTLTIPVRPRNAAPAPQNTREEAQDSRTQNSRAEETRAESSRAEVPNNPAGGFDIKGTLDKILAASDEQISQKLREMLGGKKPAKRADIKPERAAIEAVYASRNFAPVWIDDGRLNGRAKALIARLKNAGADGLDAQDYPVPEFGTFTGADALAEGDVKLTVSALTFARHLQYGRIAPTRVSVEVEYGVRPADPADILKRIISARDTDAAFDGFNPPHADFKALKEKLAELRAKSGESGNNIADGPLLKPGMKDARVPQLRERLGVPGKAGDLTYDSRLANVIKRVQHNAGLPPRGNLDSATLRAINGPKRSQQIVTVLANMERWRWLPRDLGHTYVMVNIPDFTLKVVSNHKQVWNTKIVAGKPQTPTPLTSGPMHDVIVNPSWYVPQSIIQNELLPLYDSDPRVFQRMGLEVKRGPDGHINVVQPPGAANALGHIKFAFYNKFQVYLHDTPEKRLFSHDRRAFSHGCMRVEDPTKFGEVMLSLAIPGATPNSRQIYAMYGKDERTFKMVNRPMVHLTYQTAFVDDSGKLILRNDLYGFDARIHSILHSDERKIADVAPPPDPKRDLETMRANQEILRRVERREALNPFLFFERLFR